ncbi:hypothetical protein [Tropicimonas marinistellae]|uniref:hypothetical protein n=1 Tax=Tropicimonas marinistellae TaxID=1739787 RepID=UPI00083293EE|nr:hypothetical protein [Tropicimonas marinistellae]
MPTDQTHQQDLAGAGAEMTARPARSLARMVAIPMIGLGAASCATIDMVHRHMPEFSAVPGIAGSVLAMVGLMLLMRCQVRQARDEAARRLRCQRISYYVPVMADGSSCSDALTAALVPAGVSTGAPTRRRSVSAARMAKREQDRRTKCAGASVTLFRHGPESTERAVGAKTAVTAAMRFGGEWTKDLDLSPRASAQLEADPFVKRLARMS